MGEGGGGIAVALAIKEEKLAQGGLVEALFGIMSEGFFERFGLGSITGEAVVIVIFVIIGGDFLDFAFNLGFWVRDMGKENRENNN